MDNKVAGEFLEVPFFGFWKDLPRPIIGQAPMDGVTDFACRLITARHGRPDVLFTEFTTATGLFFSPKRILIDFEYSEEERPIVAQIYGNNPDDFYRATHVVCDLGFDGVDINMGCPAKSVAHKMCGAGLIRAPELAQNIIRATQQAVIDWSRGQTLEDIQTPRKVVDHVRKMNVFRTGLENPAVRRMIPVSVKTRIGYDEPVVDSWISTILAEKPAVLTIHGRTLKQMYKGFSSWEAIARAVELAKGTGTLVFGNGDIQSLADTAQKISSTGVDGVLIGRSSIGNPWIFRHKDRLRLFLKGELEDALVDYPPNLQERFELAWEHAKLYNDSRGLKDFRAIRKHLIGYLSHMHEARTLRNQTLQTKNLTELAACLTSAGWKQEEGR